MLRYKVRPSKDTELSDFPIRELFVSPDLSYVSGTTDINVGLVDGEQIVIKSPYLIGSEMNTINVKTVKRQGKVAVTLELPVQKITAPLNFPIYSDENGISYILAFNKKVPTGDIEGDSVISSVTQNYVEYRGDICYFFDGTPSGYLVDHKFYTASSDDTSINISTFLYIEDGKLVIGNYTYYADFSDPTKPPVLRLSKEHNPISSGDFIGLLDGYKCYFGEVGDYDPTKWIRVSKFYIEKSKNPNFEVDDVLYGGYKHYVTSNNENYYLRDVYQYDEELGQDVYRGYGIVINDIYYGVTPNYVNDDLENTYHDLLLKGSYLYVGEYDEYLEIYDSLISPSSGGCFVLLMGANDGSDVVPGNFIIAESNSPIDLKRTVQNDADVTTATHYDDNNAPPAGNEYIEYEGKKYLVEAKLCDTINVSGENFILTYLDFDNDGNPISASTIINGEIMYFDVFGTKARLSYKIYYKDDTSTDDTTIVKYGIMPFEENGENENLYDITEISGVTVNGNRYPVIDESELSDEEVTSPQKYVIITENVKITLEVTEKNGLSTYVSYPVINDETMDRVTIDALQREYSNILVNNWKSFSFIVRKDTFGKRPLTVENGLMDSMLSSLPYTISDAYLLENKIEILRLQNYLSFKLPLPNNTANNLRREEIIKNDFVDYIKGNVINTVVDMEKDVYYPVWKDGDVYRPIQQLRFNLHFRTRNFDNWKIYEDDREFKGVDTPNSVKSNWFITDLKYYNNIECGNKIKLHNASDLLGFINFSTDDIKNQSTKIGKSFLRLSFYSTNDPKTQVLLATSTIFLDKNFAYKKYINLNLNSDLTFIDTKIYEENGNIQQSSSNTISNASEVFNDCFFNDDARLSSRIVIDDKYSTRTSSEGYYIYMFKDYAKKMREEIIYMKVDFNHAGIGKTIAFMLPRDIDNDDVDGIGRPLYMHLNDDAVKLKDGFKLTDIYKQTHIPIKVIYDDKENRYVYYLPSELRENTTLGVENEIMEFNLFEVKFANESIVENVS